MLGEVVTAMFLVSAAQRIPCRLTFLHGRASASHPRHPPGLGLAFEQASQTRDILKDLAKEALILIILDQLKLIPATEWFESTCDFMSVQATLFRVQGSTWRSRMSAHMTFYNRIE